MSISSATTTRPQGVVVGVAISIVMTVVSFLVTGALMLNAIGDEGPSDSPLPESDNGLYLALAFAVVISALGVVAAVKALGRSERWRNVLLGLSVLTLVFSVINGFSAWTSSGGGTAALVAFAWAAGALTVICLVNSVRAKAWFDDPFLPD